MTTTELVLGAFATFRLTWLVSADTIAEPLRRWVESLGRPKLCTLITCQWCLSVWFGALVAVAAWQLDGAAFLVPAAALTFSAVAGLLSNATKSAATAANDDGPDVVVLPDPNGQGRSNPKESPRSSR